MIANGAILEGKATVDIDEFMKNQNPDDLKAIRHNLAQSSENLNNALEGLSMVFESVNEILKENQKIFIQQQAICQKPHKILII